MNENNHPVGTGLMLFAAGGLAGAVLAFLFAPQSGARTRRQIQRTREDLGDRIDDFRHDLEENLDRLVDESMGRVEKGLHRATELADKVREELLPALEKGKELLSRRAG